jgi:hypothetical protein
MLQVERWMRRILACTSYDRTDMSTTYLDSVSIFRNSTRVILNICAFLLLFIIVTAFVTLREEIIGEI